jgi:hypothetical protein
MLIRNSFFINIRAVLALMSLMVCVLSRANNGSLSAYEHVVNQSKSILVSESTVTDERKTITSDRLVRAKFKKRRRFNNRKWSKY